MAVVNHRIEVELKRLEQEKAELSKQLDIVSANIAILYKVAGNGADEVIPPLGQAATEAMKNLKRFNKAELAARVRHNHSTLEFSDASLGKPMKVALETGK